MEDHWMQTTAAVELRVELSADRADNKEVEDIRTATSDGISEEYGNINRIYINFTF